ncbi:MAG: aldehyde ferredoxin oxidoreductase family protein [Desulfomonilia bacterium]|nr:aldehyde ferredoxin oxidoreductase family protein [Desulfomonilia bacterium]
MPNGYTGTILRVDLTSGTISRENPAEDFYRTYMGGGAIGTYFLLRETSPETDAFSEENLVTIAPGVPTGAAVSGVSRCCFTSLSPETGAVADSQAGGELGPMIKRAGYDAIIVTGKAPSPSYLLVDDATVEIRDASRLWGRSVLEVHELLSSEIGGRKICVLQCGPAGERRVRFACLMADLHDVAGRTGIGAVFGSKNLRAIVVRGTNKIQFADADGLKELARMAAQRLPDAGFPTTLHKYGTPGVLAFQAEAGNLSTHNYTRGFHEDYKALSGQTFQPIIGAGQTTCYACVVGCRKKVRAEKPYLVTDRMGGPEFETLGLLGSNLDITDAVAVAKANELCNSYGLDTITMGGLAAYVFESMEHGLIPPEAAEGRSLRFGDAEDLLWLIEKVALRDGIGDVLAEGFEAAVQRFGEETRAFAMHVKNHGLAAHMTQVKPSQALIYAVCPIGADHMSSEHDWLLAKPGDLSWGLGILGEGDPSSTGLNKVRMSVYSQYFYSMLDTLCLCMFCWGCGNLFSYRDLETLLFSTVGWNTTLWELMKVGERRINMMRQLNAKRGFSREHDSLPSRLADPLPDGPSQGRCVSKEALAEMLDMYYSLMGWDLQSGNPTRGKLLELGLEWTL